MTTEMHLDGIESLFIPILYSKFTTSSSNEASKIAQNKQLISIFMRFCYR